MGSKVPMGDSTKSGSKYKRPMEAATNKVIHRVLSLMSASEISIPGKFVCETQGPIPAGVSPTNSGWWIRYCVHNICVQLNVCIYIFMCYLKIEM